MNQKRAGSQDAFDPICGRRLDTGTVRPYSAEYKKRRYYFCSERCRNTFQLHTERLRLGDLARAGALLSQGRVSWGVA